MKIKLTEEEAKQLMAAPLYGPPELRNLLRRWQGELMVNRDLYVTEEDMGAALRLLLNYGRLGWGVNMEWTVRVINFKHEAEDNHYKHNYYRLSAVWVQSLAQMGLVDVLANGGDREVLQFRHPDMIGSRMNSLSDDETHQWAVECASAMESRRINAVAAPRWPTVG